MYVDEEKEQRDSEISDVLEKLADKTKAGMASSALLEEGGARAWYILLTCFLSHCMTHTLSYLSLHILAICIDIHSSTIQLILTVHIHAYLLHPSSLPPDTTLYIYLKEGRREKEGGARGEW